MKTKLQQLRIEKQILQEDMADLLGVKQSTYSRKERGQIYIMMREWELLARVMNVEIEDIYEDNDHSFISGRIKNSFLSVPEMILEDIEYLKKENNKLKKIVKQLRSEKRKNNED